MVEVYVMELLEKAEVRLERAACRPQSRHQFKSLACEPNCSACEMSRLRSVVLHLVRSDRPDAVRRREI